jgi:hypothetical protein
MPPTPWNRFIEKYKGKIPYMSTEDILKEFLRYYRDIDSDNVIQSSNTEDNCKSNETVLHITKSDLENLLSEVNKIKDLPTDFNKDPMPDFDMDERRYAKEKLKRGVLLVSNNSGSRKFIIDLRDCESENLLSFINK